MSQSTLAIVHQTGPLPELPWLTDVTELPLIAMHEFEEIPSDASTHMPAVSQR
ncbi:MAG: hypothetical protein H7338_11840 [Candidatus Sericytochromatia bacterium]|nr:hypothetical protein [Candidatus Sericytochromatia bacterium]